MNIDAVYVTIQTIVQSNLAKGCTPLKSKVLHPVQDLDPIIGHMAPWTHMSQPPNGILIGSAIFAHLTRGPNAPTDRHIVHMSYDIDSNSSHLCIACKRRGRKLHEYIIIMLCQRFISGAMRSFA